jgi:hypothetical protein
MDVAILLLTISEVFRDQNGRGVKYLEKELFA